MNYRPRPGIVKTKLCGMNVLIPTREASEYCQSIQVLPMLWAATWEAFDRGSSIEKAIPVHVIFTKKTPEECRENLQKFCTDMVKKGFFIEIPEESPQTDQEAGEQTK